MPVQRMPIEIELPAPERVDAADLARMWLAGETDLLCVLGPTASGKTRYAVRLARELDVLLAGDVGSSGSDDLLAGALPRPSGKASLAVPHEAPRRVEIISADSRQVYRGMDIGTGKDLNEYGDVPYHLIDIAPAGSKFNVYEYQKTFRDVYNDILRRGCIPLLCGGTGLYIEAAALNYDFGKPPGAESYAGVGPEVNNSPSDQPGMPMSGMTWKMPARPFFIGTLVSREERVRRIDRRLDERLSDGMVEEIRGLLDSGIAPSDLIYYGLEYKFVTQYVIGEISYDYMREHLANAIHQFAKRQMTWFRGMERDGHIIHWVLPE